MSWFWFSILSVIVFALVNISDKYLLIWYAKSTTVAVQILGLFSIILAIGLDLIKPSGIIIDATIFYALMAGILEITYIYYYLRAIEKDEVAYMVPLFALAPLVAFIIEIIFLRQQPSLVPIIGVFVVISGIVLFHLSRYGFYRLELSIDVWYMLSSAIVYGIYGVVVDVSLTQTSFYNTIVWSRVGVFLGAVFILLFNRISIFTGLTDVKRYAFIISEILYFIALWLFLMALNQGNVVYVMGIENIQPFFVFLMSYILYLFNKSQILKEGFSFKNKLLALVSISIIVIGTTMITL